MENNTIRLADEDNEEINNIIDAIAWDFTVLLNSHGGLSGIQQTLEHLPVQQMYERAHYILDEFEKIRDRLSGVKTMFRPRTPQAVCQFVIEGRTVFSPYQHVALVDCNTRTENVFELINSILSVNQLCPPDALRVNNPDADSDAETVLLKELVREFQINVEKVDEVSKILKDYNARFEIENKIWALPHFNHYSKVVEMVNLIFSLSNEAVKTRNKTIAEKQNRIIINYFRYEDEEQNIQHFIKPELNKYRSSLVLPS